eukprot:GHVT01100489.1.p1 GENE.GHVT01100489.1~~GHVT01100489.1.p1  ORF type:complete len:123 (+),score=2.92 GHVT01100489.1:119-487(+)
MSFCFAKGFSADNHIRMRAKSASKPSWRLSKLGLLLALPLIVQISPVAAKKGAVQFASNRSVWQTGFGNSGRVEPPSTIFKKSWLRSLDKMSTNLHNAAPLCGARATWKRQPHPRCMQGSGD